MRKAISDAGEANEVTANQGAANWVEAMRAMTVGEARLRSAGVVRRRAPEAFEVFPQRQEVKEGVEEVVESRLDYDRHAVSPHARHATRVTAEEERRLCPAAVRIAAPLGVVC